MSLDTKYRPSRYTDVLGQENIKTLLREFVKNQIGFHQSYVFAGPSGQGKTTLARIFARALHCKSPVGGEPCDQCHSCISMLNQGNTDCFTEIDAATNSGKDEIKKLIEDIEYDTFSGRKQLYLFDEAHRLSKDAFDALLKPLEDETPGSKDKKLVCIFCTTEPEGMRGTIISRCAPTFVIKPLSPELIAERLGFICQQEQIKFEEDPLKLIAQISECNVRDAIKAIEGISLLGEINLENTNTYLGLSVNESYLDVLLSSDLPHVLRLLDGLSEKASPLTIYQKLANASMAAFQLYLGASKPALYWNPEKMEEISKKGNILLSYASTFSSRPGRPTLSMLKCDLATLHLGKPEVTVLQHTPIQKKNASSSTFSEKPLEIAGTLGGSQAELRDGVFIDKRGIAKKSTVPSTPSNSLDTKLFCRLLGMRVTEMRGSIG